MKTRQELEQALEALEATLKTAGLWRVETPTPAAFASRQPFCIDTMSLPQWLRFVFVARLRGLLEEGAALPEKCEVAPAVKAYLQQEGVRASDQLLVVQSVERVDAVINQA
ncbi:YqcC family protein [Halomonas piscis]|uniref:YqcC family protein n=1 Tax=Halomonas piscis TaxID=3031727 RepID=A0ABY9YWE7_9GAMM|nr:YqcC family protein [Halomonas piscis]WNK19188.1 YqcC family protein [Halomonas piscis]